MTDTTTFFARVSSFFLAFWVYVLKVLSTKHKSTTLFDDLEVGIPSGKRRISGNFNAALPGIRGSCPVSGIVDIHLNTDSKTTKTGVVFIATHNVPSVIETDHLQPTIKIDRSVPILFPAVHVIPKIDFVGNRSKHRVVQFGPYSLHEDYMQSMSRKHQDSFSDLLDLFPLPPAYIPPLHPVINGDVISQAFEKTPLTSPQSAYAPPLHRLCNGDVFPQTVEKTPLAPAEICPSPTISEEELAVSSSSGSTSTLSADSSISISISISTSNETADSSIHKTLEISCSSAIFKVLSSGIDVKDKNISRLTLIQNPEILLLPAIDVRNPSAHSRCSVGPKSFCAFTKKDLPETYHDVVGSPEQADLQKGDISRDTLSKERQEVDTPPFISEDFISQGYISRALLSEERKEVDTPAFTLEDHISRGKKYQANPPQSLEDSLAPIPNFENSSYRSLDEHMSVRAPVQVVPAEPTEWVRPYVAPLRIVKKKVQPAAVPLEPLVARRPPSANWEQAMDDVLQAFRDAELEDSDFSGLFSGDDSFLTQSSEINSPRDDRGYLDNHGDECEARLEESFYSIDESLSMVTAPPDLVVLKVENHANVCFSPERAVSRLVMEVVDKLNKVNVPDPRLCDCEGCEDSHSWTATMDEDEDEDNHSQEDDQWSERLDLNEYAS